MAKVTITQETLTRFLTEFEGGYKSRTIEKIYNRGDNISFEKPNTVDFEVHYSEIDVIELGAAEPTAIANIGELLDLFERLRYANFKMAGAAAILELDVVVSEYVPYQLNGGDLIPGLKYIITGYSEGDDFTNVGAALNETGQEFIATGSTAASWNNASELQHDGSPVVERILKNDFGNFNTGYNSQGLYGFHFDKLLPETGVLSVQDVYADSNNDAFGFIHGWKDDTVTYKIKVCDLNLNGIDGALHSKRLRIQAVL